MSSKYFYALMHVFSFGEWNYLGASLISVIFRNLGVVCGVFFLCWIRIVEINHFNFDIIFLRRCTMKQMKVVTLVVVLSSRFDRFTDYGVVAIAWCDVAYESE